MGLFSTKKETIVGTTVSRVIQDSMLPDATKTGVIKSIFAEGEIVDYVMEELVNSVGVKVERMYEYAKRSYTWGMPSGQFHSATQGKVEVEAILSAAEGAPILLDYCQYGPPNDLHIGWMKLVSQFGYNPATNQLATKTAEKGKPAYLTDMVVVVPEGMLSQIEQGSLDQWGVSPRAGYTPDRVTTNTSASLLMAHSPVVADPVATEELVRVTYVYETPGTILFGGIPYGAPVLTPETFTIPLTGYDDDADYFHVKYTVNGVIKYWMYQAGAGTHPELDAVFNAPQVESGTYFPFLYFRYDKHSEISDKSTDAYKTSKKMVEYLGMDYNAVAEAIDENPDIADVQQAMMVMAVPATTEDPMEQRYLFQYFENLFYDSDTQYTSAVQSAMDRMFGIELGIGRATAVIQDSRFKMALSNAGLFKRRVAGSIGAVGSYSSGKSTAMVEQQYSDSETGETRVQNIAVDTHFYRKQVSSQLYDEIEVADLRMMYYVSGNYAVTADGDDKILLVPLDHSITETYSPVDREKLYTRSLHYVFNSLQIIKIKWYQSDWFQILMIVVAIVFTIWSMGADGGSLLGAVIAGNTALATTLALALLQKILIGLVISAALKLFVKAVGVNVAIIIALVAAAYGYYQAMEAGSIAGAPWAKDLLALSTNLIKAAQSAVSASMSDLLGQANDLNTLMAEQTKLLSTAQELLDGNNLLSPFVIFGESPDDFYNRTVHSGNIGVVGIDAISSYVAIALTLPKLNDTIGDPRYE